ncbi:MAG: DUF6470 family protein [Bacillota bacterium]|nr:DUF6470 family protein [Bacillota bacterium]
MDQLIEIKRIPMQLEIHCTRAQIKMKTNRSVCRMNREGGSLNVSRSYPQLKIDTYESRARMGFTSVTRSADVYAQKGVQAANDATARIIQEGNTLMDNDNSISDIMFSRMSGHFDAMLGFTPSVPAKIEWKPEQLNMQYEADRMSFEWRTNSEPEYEYTPADVECIVKQYPKIEILYKGKPVYIPPKANPDYDPETDDLINLDITA